MNNNKTIYLLIGAKGSGKSFIGELFQENFDIPFLRVEKWAKEVKNDREITNELYRIEAFAVIENGVRSSLKENDNVVFESIGITKQFDIMLKSLKEDFRVVKVGIKANLDLCLHRVKARDQSIHINISAEEINIINSTFAKKNMQTDYTIDNNNKSANELITTIKKIINNT